MMLCKAAVSSTLCCIAVLLVGAQGFAPKPASTLEMKATTLDPEQSSRRQFFTSAAAFAAASLVLAPEPASASTRAYHMTHKIKKQEQERRSAAPLSQLPSGVSFQELRFGDGGIEVQPGTMVKAHLVTPFAKATGAIFTVGSGQLLGGFEEGLLGMRLNGLRRIILPASLVAEGRQAGVNPLPNLTPRQLSRLRDDEDLSIDVEIVALK